ncbi:MAG: glycyl-radical enzyme activating protein [Bacteroidales bacterium]|nr:glycyl-radical enzyme activating protein [Bacteroidales bacterium]
MTPPATLIFDIRRYCIHDGPGIRTTVFFKGCPMRCLWCHNPESQGEEIEEIVVQRKLDDQCFEYRSAVGGRRSAVEVMQEIDRDAVFYSSSGGGVTFSGGEPLMQADFLAEILALCRKKGYHAAIDTSGHAGPAAMRKIIDLVDLWLYDLKLMDDAKHVEFTEVSNELALLNLETLAREKKDIIIRFPVIPGITDDDHNISEIIRLMIRFHLERIDLLSYHDIAKEKYRKLGRDYVPGDIQPPSAEKMMEIMDTFVQQGINVEC